MYKRNLYTCKHPNVYRGLHVGNIIVVIDSDSEHDSTSLVYLYHLCVVVDRTCVPPGEELGTKPSHRNQPVPS